MKILTRSATVSIDIHPSITNTENCQDTPAWEYIVKQQVYCIRNNLRFMLKLSRYIRHLRNGGEGTAECGELENLAKDILAIQQEGRSEWQETASKLEEKYNPKKSQQYDEPKEEGIPEEELVKWREERSKAYRHHIDVTYVKKMKAKLGHLEAATGEVDTLKGQLKTSWEELSRLSKKELDEMQGY